MSSKVYYSKHPNHKENKQNTRLFLFLNENTFNWPGVIFEISGSGCSKQDQANLGLAANFNSVLLPGNKTELKFDLAKG